MTLDFSLPWSLVRRDDACRTDPSEAGTASSGPVGAASEGPRGPARPEDLAAAEIAAALERVTGRPLIEGDGRGERIIVLDCGEAGSKERKPGRPSAFAWRASADRVEIHGADGAGLLRGTYDFLRSLGARWLAPGAEHERLPRSTRLSLAEPARRSPEYEAGLILVLAHDRFLERYGEYLPWAARNGYSSIFVRVAEGSSAFDAASLPLYEALRDGIAPLAAGLGLRLELGGPILSRFLEPAPTDGTPRLDSYAFRDFVVSHPEIEVFHAWDGAGRGAGLDERGVDPGRGLALAKDMAAIAAEAGTDRARRVSFRAKDEVGASSGLDLGELPPALDLVWVSEERSWAAPLDDQACALNAARAAAFERSARAWSASGGGRVAVIEPWEDAVLFKGAVPPLARVIEGDVGWYLGRGRGGRDAADAVGIVLRGARLPLAPRLNAWILPRLAGGGDRADSERDWASSLYESAAEPMERYREAMAAAWCLDLDLEPGETARFSPSPPAAAADEPPADWGDPWKTSYGRLEVRRARCEELFDRLREAEAALVRAAAIAPPASPAARAIEAERLEYGVAGSLLELDCARLAMYHEAAAGDAAAAGDIALLVESAMKALFHSLKAVPDSRSRRASASLVFRFYALRARKIRREAMRNPLRRRLSRIATILEDFIRRRGAE